MKRVLQGAVLAALLSVSCGAGADLLYDNNDLQLVTAYNAKNVCSCLWVMHQTQAYCQAWTKASPDLARSAVDHENKSVTTSAMLLWSATARYVDDVVGCQLDE